MQGQDRQQFTASLLKALGLHLLVVIFLFVSFSSAPEFEPAKPIVRATLVSLNSKSPASTQTDQKIAGEADRTAAQRHEAEELQREQQKQQKQKEQEAAQRAAAEQQKAAAAKAASAQAEKDRAAKEQTAKEQAKAAEERKKAEQVQQQKAAEAKRKADAAKKLAEEEAAKKAAAEAAKRKAAEEAKRKAAEAKNKAAEEAKRKAEAEKAASQKAEADRVAKLKREQEEAKAKALADLLASETQYQRAQADQLGDEVSASYDDVIRRYVSEQWRRPPTARNGMVVEVRITMLPSGDITDAVVIRSSGDAGFDQSAVQAVRNVGRIPEMQQLSRESPSTFDRLYRQRTLRFKPEDLAF